MQATHGKWLADLSSSLHKTAMHKRLSLLAASVLGVVSLSAADLRIGMIGLDTSHVVEFTKRFNDATDKNHVPGAKVVVAFKGGSPDLQKESMERVEKYTPVLQEKYGVKIVNTIEELCAQCDVVMLESVDGRPHLSQVTPVIKAHKPVFIDKPVAGSLRDAIAIFKLAKENNVPIFSGSSLRYYPNLQEMKKADIGPIKGATSTGPAHLESHHPDLFWYGIHPTEALYTVMGTGCETVTCTFTPATHVVTGVWKDGKVATLRGLREGLEQYRVQVFGTKKVLDEPLVGDYTPFLREVMTFFQTGVAPVPAQETLEIYAFMEAADESKRQGGCPVKIADVMKKASTPAAP
ncbi:MAG: Oxidoreductase family, NAD-binding Rossmann fold [Verrucomicrobiales bacterium]|nr:Oxidoreductase family, NAD-binding Rossmann fold [Verrucomicrobiales bacterium]